MKKILLFFAMALCFTVPVVAKDFYVDSDSTVESTDGTINAPYKTIAAVVKAANWVTEEASTVYVRGNHLIDDEDDLVTVTATGMTIRAWGEVKPLVEISGKLSFNLNVDEPKVFVIEEGADDCTISNISFKYYSVNLKQKDGNSLGKSGRVISVLGHRCTVTECEFRHEGDGTGRNSGYITGGGLVYNETPAKGEKAKNMVVSDCFFEGVGFGNERIVKIGSNSEIIRNVFKNCSGYYMYATKQTSGGYFASNRVVNCSSPIYTNSENYSEIPNAEIAYNIFVASDIPFILRNGSGRGMTGSPKIHHNTVIGCSSFICVESLLVETDQQTKDKAWAPLIFDNLFVSGEGSSFIREEEDDYIDRISTSFVTEGGNEPRIAGNVYFSTSFSDGSATYLDGYNLYGHGLVCENNKALSVAPEFINTTDVSSEDYYCLNSLRYPWVLEANGADGFTSEYIGAVPPKAIEAEEGEYFQFDSFIAEYSSLSAPASVKFTVGYSQNAGEVEVSWDFNGDGVVDQRGYDRSVTCVYEKPGDYLPRVKIKDLNTAKELEASLKGVLKVRLKDAYVDSLAENGGEGSKENPFKTIREGVDACGEDGVVYINGGEGRLYEINSVADVLTVNMRDIAIKSFDGVARVLINNVLDEDERPVSLITVLEGADNFEVSGLEFVYDDYNLYRKLRVEGQGEKKFYGYIIDIYGDNTKIDNCVFRLIGDGNAGEHTYAIWARAEENDQDPGEDITVSNCIFKDETGDTPKMRCFHCGLNPEIINNTYINCETIFYPLKKGNCDFSFISNRLSNCSSLCFLGGSNNEIPKGVIAYNIFTTTKGEPFITRRNYGFTSKDSYIHNNTIIGSKNFIYVSNIDSSSFTAWQPQIYNNLLILSPDAIMIKEDGVALNNGFYSSFKTEVDKDTGIGSPAASFHNNVYMSSDQFSTGTVTELEGYDLSKGLKVENNTVLTVASNFMSTDPSSPDFMRVKSKKGDWAYATAVGGYPNYVGAVEPLYRPNGMFIFIR